MTEVGRGLNDVKNELRRNDWKGLIFLEGFRNPLYPGEIEILFHGKTIGPDGEYIGMP